MRPKCRVLMLHDTNRLRQGSPAQPLWSQVAPLTSAASELLPLPLLLRDGVVLVLLHQRQVGGHNRLERVRGERLQGKNKDW